MQNRSWAQRAGRSLRQHFATAARSMRPLHPPSFLYRRNVVAVEGDSAFGFSGMECETICR